MDVAGLTGVDRDGSGKYGDDELSVSDENVDLSALLPEGADSVTARVQVSATGINFDRQADDDTGREAVFTVVTRPRRCRAPARARPGRRHGARARTPPRPASPPPRAAPTSCPPTTR